MDPEGRAPVGLPVAADHPDHSPPGVMFGVGLGLANVGFYVASIGVVLVMLATELGVPVEDLAWFGSTFGYGLIVVALAGPIALRAGPRRVLAGAAALLGAGSLALALPSAPLLVYAGAVLQGVGAAGIILVAPGLLRGPGAEAKLTRVNAAASVAGVSAPLLLGAAAAAGLGGRLPLLLLTAAMVVLAVLALRLPDERRPAPGAAEARPLARGTAARRWLAVVCSVSVEFFFVVWGVARLTGTGLAVDRAALVGASFQIGMAIGRLAAPRLIGRVPVVAVGAALAAVGTVLVVAAGSWPLVGLGQLVSGVGVAVFYPITLARLMGTPGLRPELGASLGALASGTAIMTAPVLLATLALAGDLRIAFLAALPVLALLLWLHHERPKAG